MAKFNTIGLDDLQMSFEEWANFPDEVKDEILEAGATVAIKALKQSISSLGIIDTKQLHASIKATKPKTDKYGNRILYVYPQGTRKKISSGTKLSHVSIRGRIKSGTGKKTRNADVGFIMEFGAPHRGIPARQWMRTAIERNADEIVEAERKVYDGWLNSKGL